MVSCYAYKRSTYDFIIYIAYVYCNNIDFCVNALYGYSNNLRVYILGGQKFRILTLMSLSLKNK